jgi:ADP-ribosyl-[dinitrogen reductase] hydrolase
MSSPLPPGDTSTKIRTSLLSLAICDALGGPVEFHARGTFPQITSMQPNHNFSLPAGAWTDDTSMALCLADSLINSSRFSETDQASRYVRWLQTGYLSVTGTCFDAGNATRVAVSIWASGGGLDEIRSALDRTMCCGNGSLMRVLPVALMYWSTPGTARDYARRSSLTTHPHRLCQEACELYVYLITTILGAADSCVCLEKADLVLALRDWDYENQELHLVFATGSWVNKDEREISSSGYVLHTLEAALWVFLRTHSFEEGAIMAVNLGDDADTVAAVYGGIAGAWYGGNNDEFWSGRVKEWRERLLKREVVEKFADELIMKA